MRKRTFQVSVPCSLLDALAEAMRLERTGAAQLLQAGAVQVNRVRTLKDVPLRGGERVEVYTENRATSEKVQVNWGLRILSESREWIAVDKPAFLATLPEPDRLDSVLTGLSTWLGAELYSVHRLDKGTTGVLLFAKTKAAASELTQQFKNKRMSKVYVALSQRSPTFLDIDVPVGRDSAHATRQVAGRGVSARTILKVLYGSESGTCMLARPFDGRTHQIRVHAAYAGAPLWGDGLYGGFIDGSAQARRPMLHACLLRWDNVVLRAPCPDDMSQCLTAWGAATVVESIPSAALALATQAQPEKD